MKKRTLKTDPSQFLSGWKEIANFLGMGVRTIQRYERELGLPVRRPAGKVRGSVVAVKAELDGWVKASPIRDAFRLRNADQDYRQSTQALHKGVSELATLHKQMSMLRSELHDSVERLRGNIELLQGEVNQRQNKSLSPVYSHDERDLLDRTMPNTIIVPIKYPKAN